MKVAFLIVRLNFYRIVGPLIDEALRQGWEVECWHDTSQPRDGMKGYQFPSIDACPTFVHGRPTLKTYHGPSVLEPRLQAEAVDVVVSIYPPVFYLGHRLAEGTPPWVGVQDMLDLFFNGGPEG